MPLDYDAARRLLEETLAEVSQEFLQNRPAATIKAEISRQCAIVFQSTTQAYRESLLSCILAKFQDAAIDVHKPYINQGTDAYNGRTLDERVVNPFFHDNRIPSSKGPFLSTFRRSVLFTPDTRGGLRDKDGFDAMLACVDFIADASPRELRALLKHMMYRFVELREASAVSLTRIQRFSLQQYGALIDRLLKSSSGGRFPVFSLSLHSERLALDSA